MSSSAKRPKSRSTHQSKTFEEKLKAIEDVDGGLKKSIVAQSHGIPLSTLSTWLKSRDKIETAVKDGLGERKRRRNGQFRS